MAQCCVLGCKNTGNHRFPRNKQIRKLWIKATRCPKTLVNHEFLRVCASHFTKSDFKNTASQRVQQRHLLQRAVPSIFPWTKSTAQHDDSVNMNVPGNADIKNQECRVCLNKANDADLCDIFQVWYPEWRGMQATIADDLAKIAYVKISPSDKLPKIICSSCYDKLKNAAIFAENVRNSDEYLRQKYGELAQEEWPQPIQVTKNINGAFCGTSMEVEVKQEVVSEDECGVDGAADYLDTDIKIEPQDIEESPPMQIKINNTVSLGALQTDNEDNTNSTSNTPELLLEKPATSESIGVVDMSRLVDIPVKEEPLSEDETISDLPMECMLCMKSFSSVTGLKAHVITQHSYKTVKRKIGAAPTPEKRTNIHCCQICKRSFVTRTDLMVHETCHNKYSCYKCDAKFDTFDLLTKHRKRCKAAPANHAQKVKTLDDVLRHQVPNSKESPPVPANKDAVRTRETCERDANDAEIITPDNYYDSPKRNSQSDEISGDHMTSVLASEKSTVVLNDDYKVCAIVYLPTYDSREGMELDHQSEKPAKEMVPTDKVQNDSHDTGTRESSVNSPNYSSNENSTSSNSLKDSTSDTSQKDKSLKTKNNHSSNVGQKDTRLPSDKIQNDYSDTNQNDISNADQTDLSNTDQNDHSNVSENPSDTRQNCVDKSRSDALYASQNDPTVTSDSPSSITTQNDSSVTNQKNLLISQNALSVTSPNEFSVSSQNDLSASSQKDPSNISHKETHDSLNMDVASDTFEEDKNICTQDITSLSSEKSADIIDKSKTFEVLQEIKNNESHNIKLNSMINECDDKLNKRTKSNNSLDNSLEEASMVLASEKCQVDRLEEATMEVVLESEKCKVDSPEEANIGLYLASEKIQVGVNHSIKPKQLSIKSPKDINDSVIKIDTKMMDTSDSDMKLHLEIHTANNDIKIMEYGESDAEVEEMLCDSDE